MSADVTAGAPAAAAERIREKAMPTSALRVLGALVVGLAAVQLALLAINHAYVTEPQVDVVAVVALCVLGITGVTVLNRQADNRVGRLLLAASLFGLVELTGLDVYADLSLAHDGLPGARVALALDQLNFAAAFYPIVTLLPLIFPSGRATSRWARWIAGGGGVGAVVLFAAGAVDPHALDSLQLTNPIAVGDGTFSNIATPLGFLLFTTSFVAAALSVTRRFRRSTGEERQQLLWFVSAALLMAGQLILCLVGAVAGIPYLTQWAPTAVLVLVAAIAVAVLRYRLWDLDLVVNRAIAYATLTTVVAGVYVAIVVGLGSLVSARGSTGLAVSATAVVAIAVQPLRGLVQRGVDRLMYGRRREPLSVLAAVGRRLALTSTADALLPHVVSEVGEALRLGGLAVVALDGSTETPLAAHGDTASPALRVALLHQGEAVGALLATPRRGENLGMRELRLLEDLAPQLAVAVHALRLTSDLRRSREQLVAALEDERRRIRRDLHDGLGPTLTAVTLQADAARNVVRRDPERAEAMLVELRSEVAAALTEIRRLVYNLRPPALDELGLVGALRQHASRFADTAPGHERPTAALIVTVDAPSRLPELPAAVEVAAYRIVTEAITNAARHAEARVCRVRLSIDDGLAVEIIDDGRGIDPAAQPGVGLRSMRERAAELGGWLVVEAPARGGGQVRARLPLELPVAKR